MKALPRMSSRSRQFLNFTVTFISVILCILILPTRMPGMELLGISPNWLLIWVVAWSMKRKRTVLGAASMGLVLGFLQDAMTAPDPTHAVSLVVVAVLTVVLLKTWSLPADLVERDPIPIALIVFGMAVLAETVMGLQFLAMGDRTLVEIWSDVFCYSQQSLGSGDLFSPKSLVGNDEDFRKILVISL